MVLPAWFASMVQVPLEMKVTTPELTPVHTVVVVEVKATGRPEVAVAFKSIGALPKAIFVVAAEGEVTVMVCVITPSPDTENVPVWASAALVAVMVVLKGPVSEAAEGLNVMVAGKLEPLVKGKVLQVEKDGAGGAGV